jgi:hypothetical protein
MTSETHYLDRYIFPGKLGTKGVPKRMYVSNRDSGSFYSIPSGSEANYFSPDSPLRSVKHTCFVPAILSLWI